MNFSAAFLEEDQIGAGNTEYREISKRLNTFSISIRNLP